MYRIYLYSIFLFAHLFAQENLGLSFVQNLTGDDLNTERDQWDQVYQRKKGYVFGKQPAPFLAENIKLLPIGFALDLGMGEGRNSVYLAKKGFFVEGVDISHVAIIKAKKLALENRVQIKTTVADLRTFAIPKHRYNLIIDFYFLDRALFTQVKNSLLSGGVFVFEGYIVDQLKLEPTLSKDLLLEKGELKKVFEGWKILKYEEGLLKSGSDKKHIVRMIAKKP
ncbi:MAG: class I SAM-dependent methyltransferase [Bacteriovoracia bacterium]